MIRPARLLRRAVWNDAERRLRAGWRLALATLAFAIVNVASAITAVALGRVLVPGTVGSLAGVVTVTAPVRLVGILLLVGGFAVAVDRRRLRDYGFGVDRAWLLDAVFGFALGGLLQTLIFLVELAAGWVAVVGTAAAPGWPAFGPAMAAIAVAVLAVGIYEEAFVRGYILTNLAEGLTGVVGGAGDADGDREGAGVPGAKGAILAAAVLSSAAFGLLHAGNPGATAVSVLGITFAGGVLALGYLLTGELAIPIGLHVSWNLFQGAVYGFPVSGTTFGASLLATEVDGPAALTGGGFGPEAGLLGIAALAGGGAAIAAWVRYRTGEASVDRSIATPELRWR